MKYMSLISDLFDWYLNNNIKKIQKEYRNTIMTIIMIISNRKNSLEFFGKTNILSNLLLSYGDIEALHRVNGDKRLSDLDKDFILLVWSCLSNIIRNSSELRDTVRKSNLIQVLLHYININENNNNLDKKLWSMEQRHKLCESSLIILSSIITYFESNFFEFSGNNIVKNTLQSFLNNKAEYSIHLNSILDLCSKIAELNYELVNINLRHRMTQI